MEFTAIRDLTVAALSLPRTIRRAVTLLWALFGCAVMAGCALTRGAAVPVHESARGSVYLERVPGGTLHARHPIQLDSSTLARALAGPRVEEDRLFENIGIGRGKFPPFSEDEVRYLGPFVAEALSRATPEQVVGLRVVHLTGDGIKTTEGVLWVEPPYLHLTLTRYLADVGRRRTVYREEHGPRDPTGLKGRTVTFLPEAAARATYPRDLPLLASPHLTTLVIDYERLAKLPAIEERPSRPALPAMYDRPSRQPATATDERPSRQPPAATDEQPSHQPAAVPDETPSHQPPAAKDSRPPQTAPRPAETGARTAPNAEDPAAVIDKKDREIEALKAKVRDLQRQLEGQGTESRP